MIPIITAFLSFTVAAAILERDLFGVFTLEKATLPFCWLNAITFEGEGFTKFSSIYFERDSTGADHGYARCSKPFDYSVYQQSSNDSPSVDVVIENAKSDHFTFNFSDFDSVAVTKTALECSVFKYMYSRPFFTDSSNTYPTTEPDSMVSFEPDFSRKHGINSFMSDDSSTMEYKYNNIKIAVAQPKHSLVVKGVQMTQLKRYLFIENNTGYCVYSAPRLIRLPIQGSYNLIRSPLLKPPPKYCKSKLEISGTIGNLDASAMLFDGQTDSCLKGKVPMIKEMELPLPAVSTIIQDSVKYYGWPITPLRCDNSTIQVGVAQLSREVSIANIISLKAGKYFAMVNEPMPFFNFTELLSKVTVCLYKSA